ncbi:MAG: phospholipid/cholesterol/gamma-HCH transport system substrate-binding protein [Clostridiales bacterium]|jgi:phospholipid/cholesterol/gamma-HCH transport system substrate-binding protein|nr:phospholipid/cholesterol/gamma-HCH transport system substrate-binding protein [Clostridiales bacterium]MDN5283214.1 phospholipid/cholesterol/gamma-HCH transport system substrate-binding protein [Candidatus Ozemobacter sp.]
MNSTVKVGIMTLLSAALLIYMVFIIGDFSLSEQGYNFVISFYSVNGLSKGSNVSMSGVKIGKVNKIEIRDDQVYVYVYIRDKKLHIRKKSTFTISTAGLMGEKYIEIMPTRDYASPYVADGEVVPGTDPTRMDELFEQGNVLIQKLQELTASAKDIIGDPELKENTRMIFRNARTASDKMNEIISSVRDRSDRIVESLDNILHKVDNEISQNRDEIRTMIANFRQFSERLSDITEDSRADFKDIVANVRKTTERLDNMIEELNRNNKMTDDLRATIESLRGASDNAKEITKEVKEIVADKEIRNKINRGLDDANKLAQAVDKVFLNIRQTRVDFKYLLRYREDNETFYSDLSVDLYPSDKTFYRFGVEDVGGEDLFNMMVARGADTQFIRRAGIISSKIGAGVDYLMAKDLSLSVDFIDTSDSEIRFKAGYLLNENIRFELRVDDITDKRDVNFGLEYKF